MNGQELGVNFVPKEIYKFWRYQKKSNFPSELWQQPYRISNEVTHASSQGTFNRLGLMDGEEKISVGHTDYGLTIPGEHSAITIAQLTGVAFDGISIWWFYNSCKNAK